jgi:MFS family permease
MSLYHHNKNVLQSGDKSLQRQLNQDSHPPDAENISSNWLNENRSENLSHIPTHISHTQDAPLDHWLSCGPGVPDEIYGRLPPHRKVIILALLSFCAFLAPMSSTTILAAVPEVAADYNSTGTIINLSNALYMLFMGISPCFWGPLSQVYGRRWVSYIVIFRILNRTYNVQICLITSALFCACSLGTALSPNLASYFIFRILTAFEGTSFLTVGASCIGDIYAPQERGTAMGWFLSGTLIGPALGPFIGGIIVTFRSWRVIFYLQTALAGVALIGAFFLLPETAHHKKIDELAGLPVKAKAKILCLMLNPWRVVRLFKYPNLLVVGIAASSLIWNMYSLLTPIRYVLNPRFNLISPIQSGLFYLAPGCGYVLGTFFGGRYALRQPSTSKADNKDQC